MDFQKKRKHVISVVQRCQLYRDRFVYLEQRNLFAYESHCCREVSLYKVVMNLTSRVFSGIIAITLCRRHMDRNNVHQT